MVAHLVAGAAHYVHKVDDVRHDLDDENGLLDDLRVMLSVCQALDLALPEALESMNSHTAMDIDYFLV